MKKKFKKEIKGAFQPFQISTRKYSTLGLVEYIHSFKKPQSPSGHCGKKIDYCNPTARIYAKKNNSILAVRGELVGRMDSKIQHDQGIHSLFFSSP